MNKTINKNRLIYLISSIGGHIYILFTIPLLTHYLSKDEFGLYMILTQIVVVVQATLLVLFSNGLLKFWVDTPADERESFMGTILTTFVSVALLITVALYLFRDSFFDLFFPNVTTDISMIFLYTVLWLFFIAFRSFLLSFLKALEKPKFILVHIITYGVFLVGFLYWKLALQSGSLEDVMLAIFLAEILALSVLVYPSVRNFTLSFNLAYLKVFMKFSLPLIGGSLAFIAFQNIDRVILARYVSLEDMGVYGIGFMFGSIAGMIVTANMSAYLPRVKKVMASGDEAEVKRLTTHYMQEIQDLMLIVVFAIALFSELIVYLFANSYSGSLASVVMVGVALGHLARSNYLFFEQILFLKDRVKTIFVVKLLILVLGLVLSLVLISQYQLHGASLIYFSTFIFVNLMAYKFVSSYNLVEINIKRTIAVGLVVLSLLLLQYLGINIFLLYSIEALILVYLSYRYLKLYIFKKVIND